MTSDQPVPRNYLTLDYVEAPDGSFEWDGRESFSRIIPKLQVSWDSTSLGALKKCPRLYQLSIVEGWRRTPRPGTPGNIHFRYGILYHRALEVYDHKKSEGMVHDDAMVETLLDLVEGCMDWEDLADKDAAEVATGDGFHVRKLGAESDSPGWQKLLGVWDPNAQLDPDKAAKNAKTVPNLFRSVVWYLDRFGDKDPIDTIQLDNGKPAVELSFRFDAGFKTSSTGEPILLSGHLDRVGMFAGLGHVVDRKTSSSTLGQYYFDQFNPHNQMSLYSIAGRVVTNTPIKGVIIDAAHIAKGFTAFARGITTRTEGQLEEWLSDFKFYVALAERFATSNYWPMNDTACNDFGGCAFRGICSKDPKVRLTYLKNQFHIEKWDPLKVRGDIDNH